MPALLDSHSGLSRCKRQNGIGKGKANADTVPEYIIRCRLKREILEHKAEILTRLEKASPNRFKNAEKDGFDPLIMNMGPVHFARFCTVNETSGIVEAYMSIIIPAAA